MECFRVYGALKTAILTIVQTSNFSCAESNANELEQRILLICIRFGTLDSTFAEEMTWDNFEWATREGENRGRVNEFAKETGEVPSKDQPRWTKPWQMLFKTT